VLRRKRNPWTRARERGRKRLRTPAPTTGWLIKDLAALTQISPRAIRYYVRRGLLPPPAFRGTATRYQRIHLLRGLAVGCLHKEGIFNLDVIRSRIELMGDAELVTFVTEHGISDVVAAALELPLTPRRTPSPNNHIRDPPDSWLRVPVLPGLELRVATDASPLVRQMVERICRDCSETKTDSPT
jgi:DNA-binding transcriptional MerR regulator